MNMILSFVNLLCVIVCLWTFTRYAWTVVYCTFRNVIFVAGMHGGVTRGGGLPRMKKKFVAEFTKNSGQRRSNR